MGSKTPFIHLHTHSHYSLLDGLSKITEMVSLTKSYGMPALALTDHGALYGAIQFYKECKKAGIKPIIGVEAYIAKRTRHDKQPGIDNKRFHLTLLAKNNTGYKNLIKLVTLSHLEGYYYKPRMDKELLRAHSEGLICLSGCFGSELSRALRNKNVEGAEKVITEHQEIFGKENYFLEIMHHPDIEGLNEVRKQTIALGEKFNVPLVATHDSHYLHEDDARAHDTLIAIQTNTDIGDEKRLTFAGHDFHFIDSETAWNNFKDIPEAIENTKKIADMCEIELSLGSWIFPDFKVSAETTHDKELERLTYEGLSFRNLSKTEEHIARIAYELDIIKTKQFSPYFLVVADLLRFSRENNILTNTRGSAAGSFVSYLLGITNVNPIEYKLPFERFLNPHRPSAPDIDMDFEDTRRDEVIQYAKQKYGETHVAQIGTYGTMMARGAVRDVARSLGKPYIVGDRIAKLIPMGSQGFPMTIERALETTPELRELYEKEEEVREIVDLAKRLEGCARHVSVHAAGVVIAPYPLMETVPLQYDPHEKGVITQYDMHAIEDVGLLKLDFLGIKNLTILSNSIRLAKKFHGVDIDIERIPLDDKETFVKLARGETMGLFQLNGSGMTQYLKELKPTTIHDINVMIALYRPGPMDNINEYIARKHGSKPVTYTHPKMKNFLDTTYGVLVYQDDLLMTAIEVAGYSWGEVDKFRKAVGKKIPEEMARQHIMFVEGCQKHGGMSKDAAEAMWKLFEPFQGYGFNKAHAASYGKFAYQTAYMKAHFPTEYMAAILNADAGDVEKIAEAITECVRLNISVLPPDVNESFGDFTIIKNLSGDKIRFGLYSIKNFGNEIGNAIIAEREERGKFKSFADFLERIQHKNLNKKSLESLIKCGAMDAFGNREQMLGNTEEALAYNREQKKDARKQDSLFNLMGNQESVPKLRLKEVSPVSQKEKLSWEKELLGLYISGHPLLEHKEKFKRLELDIKKVKKLGEGLTTVIGGIVEEVKTILTAKGEKMAFLKIADLGDSIETVVFPRAFNEYKDFLQTEKTILVRGKTSHRKGVPSFIIEKVKEL
ncbi:MAG: DNA polymerase III subunit alpha [Parcubacteria group bacterium]|nr:DNA polymerase III subunit alpha [Parcubacteria group bacterium]